MGTGEISSRASLESQLRLRLTLDLRYVGQAGAAQQRCEVVPLNTRIQHLVMELGEKLRHGDALALGDLLEDGPERCLQANRGDVAAEANRPGLGGIGLPRLRGKDSTHSIPSLSPPAHGRRLGAKSRPPAPAPQAIAMRRVAAAFRLKIHPR